MNITDGQYTKDCNDFFAPLDEIAEALNNNESLLGMSNTELRYVITLEMWDRLEVYM